MRGSSRNIVGSWVLNATIIIIIIIIITCEEHGYSYAWKEGQSPNLSKNGKIVPCTSDNFVPLVTPGVTKDKKYFCISRWFSWSDQKFGFGSPSAASGDRLRDMPEWLEEFAEGLVDKDSKSSGSDTENILQEHLFLNLHPPRKKGEHRISSRIFRRVPIVQSAGARKLRELFAEGILKIKMPSTTRNKFWSYKKADHKILNDEGKSRLQDRYAIVPKDLATQWV